MKRIAINGFGRIGRAALKVIMEIPELEIVAINDLMSTDNAAYLLQYDSVYGRYATHVQVEGDYLHVGDKKILFLSQKDPAQLPWKELEIDVAIESTGFFTNREDAEKHITAGARTVVISGPTKSKNTPTVLHGVNTGDGNTTVFSCASCTTNNIGPIIEIIDRRIGIKKAILNTVHAYTASQTLVDAPSKREPRMGRAAAVNLAPASTGAAIATTKALPAMVGKFDGVAVRTPVPVGSISDITFVTVRNTSPEEINSILQEESESSRYKLVLAVSNEPLVSSDIVQSPFAAIVDLELTRVVDGDLVKVMAWYDNEWGFTNQMIRQIRAL
ncbi:glyceraldehyde 3-phosphate dehydrogenase NAD-binding domain-containing protein [Agriterribacter sp.]|uniref:type I glyceraldehyde-3-phosphate dehydrogenase n=1 Tax=Agriterribacter sp. TaxID=2821509 RepID=UPI002C130CE4|nr:glyceraldehyde 3-phosphate dehydrogenase NAD-binding domain-containing protein [Agriterribacter sp.]HRP56135.1 glyceraldehyde 3-phosphate dehydrogenase NAD-binding domain-containing protein [Agriterribacter sp.]